MRVYISADMEGATGITNTLQTGSKNSDYGRGRKLLTGDVNAAVLGALDAGAEEVWVNDAHGPMTNILIEELDDRACLISGSNKPLLQMEGIDAGFDAAFFVAYHACEGTACGVLNHTIMGSVVTEIRRNDQPVGETAINAGLAGAFGVPVVLLTGDDTVAAEAQQLIPGIQTVAVKTALDRHTARCLPPGRTADLIRQAAARALQLRADIPPHRVEPPVTFSITFKTTPAAAMACLFPLVRRTGPKSVEVQSEDHADAFRQLWGALILGQRAQGGVLES